MLSVDATVYSQCVFQTSFPFDLLTGDYEIMWKVNKMPIVPNHVYKLARMLNSFVLYINSVRPFMNGEITCELWRASPRDGNGSRTAGNRVKTFKAYLKVKTIESFEEPGLSVIFFGEHIAAFRPKYTNILDRALTRIDVGGKLYRHFEGCEVIDGAPGTMALVFVYRVFEMYYVKVLYTRKMIYYEEITVEYKKVMKLPRLNSSQIKVKWYMPTPNNGYEMNISVNGKFTATAKNSSKSSFKLINLPRFQYIVCKINQLQTPDDNISNKSPILWPMDPNDLPPAWDRAPTYTCPYY